jgi:hypothetical protein
VLTLLLVSVAVLAVATPSPAAYIWEADAGSLIRTWDEGPTTSTGFGWFRVQEPPLNWLSLEMPGHIARLSYPSTAHPIYADPGAVAVAAIRPAGDYATYLNATPRQGDESLAAWSRSRLDHLADDTAGPAILLASAAGLSFRGGSGSCVIDEYTSRVGAHRYREIACLVSGARGDSVLVAPTLAGDWPQQEQTLERSVDAYTTGSP